VYRHLSLTGWPEAGPRFFRPGTRGHVSLEDFPPTRGALLGRSPRRITHLGTAVAVGASLCSTRAHRPCSPCYGALLGPIIRIAATTRTAKALPLSAVGCPVGLCDRSRSEPALSVELSADRLLPLPGLNQLSTAAGKRHARRSHAITLSALVLMHAQTATPKCRLVRRTTSSLRLAIVQSAPQAMSIAFRAQARR
jgi:hypothetical protein